MKKQVVCTLGLSLMLLTGCGNAATSSISAPPSASINAFGAGSAATRTIEELHFHLDSSKHEESLADEDGTALAHYSYEIPVLTVETQAGEQVDLASTQAEKRMMDVANTFNQNFTNWVESADFSELFSWAQEHYDGLKESGYPWETSYEEEFTYESWQTDRFISIAGHCYSYTGGAHPNSLFLGWNFDLQTGRFIYPPTLGIDSVEFQNVVTKEIIRQAVERAKEAQMAPTELFWEDYQDIVAKWPDYAVTFNDSHMTVTFSPYELGGYFIGQQAFDIGFDLLEPYLSDEGKEMLGIEISAQ